MRILVEPRKGQILEILEERKRSFLNIEENVKLIVNDVRKNGQSALEKYIAMYERCPLKGEQITVSQEEFESVKVEREFEEVQKDSSNGSRGFIRCSWNVRCGT